MELVKLLLVTSLATILVGQIIRIPIGQTGAITLTDVAVLGTVIIFLFDSLIFKKKIILPKKTFFPAALFILLALSSTILSINFFTFGQVAAASLFLIRFAFYFFITVVVLNAVEKKQILNWLNICLIFGGLFALIGLIQLLLVPNLTFLTFWGWDPHINRLVSTLIDPNFAGGMLSIFFAISISLYLFKNKTVYLMLSALFFISLVFTFSRSSLLAFFTVVLLIGLIRSFKVIVISVLIFALAFLIIAKVRERLASALAFDETAAARVKSWQNAYSIFSQNFFFGVGFNNYRYAQVMSGNFSKDALQGGHSGSGSDSSILLVAATTGIIGLSTFIYLLFALLTILLKNLKSDYLKLATTSSFLALLIHSQFVNSFFFPQIMLLFWVLVGLVNVKDY